MCGAFAVKSCKAGLDHPGFYFAHSLLLLEGHGSFVRTAQNTEAIMAISPKCIKLMHCMNVFINFSLTGLCPDKRCNSVF